MDNETLDNVGEKEESRYGEKRFRPLFVIFPFLFLASAFKLLHWPGQALLLVISLALVAAHATAMLLFLKKNEVFTNIGAASAVCGIIYYITNEYSVVAWQMAAITAGISLLGFYFWMRD